MVSRLPDREFVRQDLVYNLSEDIHVQRSCRETGKDTVSEFFLQNGLVIAATGFAKTVKSKSGHRIP
jgi:hypothetical protein